VNTARTDGHLIVNADDWGRDQQTTDCTFDCVRKGSVSAVSAMVFMEDSERAAAMAREHGIDAGLHLNFTSPFTSSQCPTRLARQQRRITAYLRAHRMAQLVFNPMLMKSFDYVVRAQVDEFRRLYGANPARIDGHHHMHLCANVVLQGLLPTGTVVRRNFSFRAGEKGIVNRTYRHLLDRALARRHPMVDHLFSIEPLNPPERLQRIFSLAQREVVELETHPINPGEYAFLTSAEFPRAIGTVPSTFAVVASRVVSGQERVHERA
jgi:chitin disaccharide deacetylase